MSKTRSQRQAFTLLELLLVLALLVMLTALAVPAWNGPMQARKLTRAADQVRTEWLRARTKAIMTGEILSFRFQPGTGHFRIEPRTQSKLLLAAAAASGAAGSQTLSPADNDKDLAVTPTIDRELPADVLFASGVVAADSRYDRLAAEDRIRSASDILPWSDPILFYPDGAATAARVIIAGERDRAVAIELRSLTGDARISGVFSLDEVR